MRALNVASRSLVLIACFLGSISLGATTRKPLSADDWYEAAIEATVAGDTEARDEAFAAALAADPDHAPTHAERGEVRIDGRWAPVAYAQHLATEDPDRQEYLERQVAADAPPAAHVRLAKWCDRRGLAYEARLHWLAALASEPENRAALSALDATWRDGKLWDVSLAKEADERRRAVARDAQLWEKRFRRFERNRVLDTEAFEAICDDLDVAAVGPIERRIENFHRLSDPNQIDKARTLIDAYFAVSASIHDVEVTASLCRSALFAEHEALRQDAIEALQERPRVDSMPLLLSALQAPIESEHQVTRDELGRVVYSHTLLQEGAEQDRAHERNRVATVSVGLDTTELAGFRKETTSEAVYWAQIQARMALLKKHLEYEVEAAETNSAVATHNRDVAKNNARVIEALEAVRGQSLGDDPRAWWDDWRRYSGYSVYDRPVDQTYDTTVSNDVVTARPTYIRLPPPPPRSCECFVAGTMVWTRDGKQAIETLSVGDLVLARDPDRGGLVFRAVTQTTTREPSPMVEIVAGDESIRATVGHPLWVVGQGWRMARQLAEGDVLSTVEGPVTVSAVKQIESAAAYNLVVEGAANYYVGDSGVLVHDNTPRAPAVGLLAGR